MPARDQTMSYPTTTFRTASILTISTLALLALSPQAAAFAIAKPDIELDINVHVMRDPAPSGDDCLGTEYSSGGYYSCDGVHSFNGHVDCVGYYNRTPYSRSCVGV